jgi:hypothetical protein
MEATGSNIHVAQIPFQHTFRSTGQKFSVHLEASNAMPGKSKRIWRIREVIKPSIFVVRATHFNTSSE